VNDKTTTPVRPPVAALGDLSTERLESMLAAGEEIRECYRVLNKVSANIVGELLKGQGTFYELDHYPKGDVFDRETYSQYYYHAHRSEVGEHGHFHCFLRAGGMPEGARPVAYDGKEPWPTGADALSHLVAVTMDKHGYPTGLFATNRWVTAEAWYAADDAVAMLDRFLIDHAWPSWPVNRWISAMFRLFRPQMEALLRQRDEVVAAWTAQHPGEDVFEDRNLEITGYIEISVDRQLRAVRDALGARTESSEVVRS
jgi:hypothetical protein